MKFHLRILAVAVLLGLMAPDIVRGTDEGGAEKRILIIYSFTINFAPDFQFSADFTREISSSGHKLRVKHLELDAFSAENATQEALAARLAPYLPDIRAGKYRVIIPIGQIAIDLLCRNAKDIPAETAVAFCGLDIVTRELYEAHPNTTGALGRVSVADNIELGLHFFPKTKRVILLTDWSIQGKRILEAGKEYGNSYPGLEYIFWDNAATDLNTMLSRVKEQDENTLVLFYAWFNRDSTNLASLQYIMSHLEQSRAPVFALQEPMLWNGAVGGVFTPVGAVGKALADRVEQILAGAKASEVTMAAIPLETSVNWSAVENGRISGGEIPANAKLVGKREFIRNEDLPKFIFGAITFAVLIGLSATVTVLCFRLRSISRKTQAILAHIPGKIVVSDVERNLLFIHSGGIICDNSSARLKLDALPDFSRKRISEALDCVFTTGKTERFECDFDGRRYNIELVKISPLVFGVEAVLWGMYDIDECYRVRCQLDEALCKSQLTLDSVGDAVIVTDPCGRVNYLNPAAYQLLADGGKLEPGLLLSDYFTLREEEREDEREREFPLVNAVIKADTVTQKENLLLRLPDRDERNVVVSLAPIRRQSGEAIGSVLTIRDVTRLRDYQKKLVAAAEKAQNADRAKSAFLATMSHELRTPLNAIIGFSEIMQQKTTPEEQAEYLTGIYTAGKALLNLINDVLDLSKIEAGQMKIVLRPTDVVKTVRELYMIFAQEVKSKGIYLRLECPEKLPLLQIDDMRLRQILLNLLGNAVKFTQKGGVALQVEYVSPEVDSGELFIHVADTGIGIRPEAQKNIFDPFIQQDSDRDSRVFKGTGLGLAISNRLAGCMGGNILLHSREGEGSDFILHLSHVAVAAGDGGEEPGVAASPAVSAEAWRAVRVLLVDDVPMNLKVLTAMLRKLEIEPLVAGSGPEALEIVKKRQVDFVLTDMWMPGMNGAELAEAIRSLPGSGGLRVVAVTADTESGTNFPQKHFSGILLKPVTLEKLEAMFGKFLAGDHGAEAAGMKNP
ncbi:MAG: response regulator [Lentisphaeria bacterium]|nr:response regulator [Lentisphaeria bacterium]